jgi:hypothetical protein
MFCHVSTEQVLGVHDLISVYHVPLLLQEQGIVPYLQKRLDLARIPISPAMVEKGRAIEQKWREVTRCVCCPCLPWRGAEGRGQRGALLRDSRDRACGQIHGLCGLVHVRHEGA